MGKSIYDLHVETVEKLKERGEPILGGMEWDEHTVKTVPDVYVKGAFLGVDEFVCGHAIPEKDGTYTVTGDFFAYERPGYSLDQLGLCNPKLWYTTRLFFDRARKGE